MEKPFVKSLTAVAVGAGAIAICLFGYHINNQRQHQQRINYAESAITNQKDTLTSLSKEVDKLYSTKEKIFLNPEITEETITSLSNKLSSVKLSADDYDIKESELPKEAVAIQDEKKAIVTQLDSAESKLKIQTAVNDLFTKNVSNWQQAVDDVIIKERVTSADVARVRENMSFFKDSPWKTVVMQYLGFADTQIAQVTQLDQLFDTMLKDGQVTATATYDQYADVLIQFADLQLSVPHVYSWTVKNGIKYIPYNGITRSQSGNKYIKTIIEILAHRNYKIYKKNGCVAKNDRVSEKLVQLGVNKVKLAPVCVDFEQLHKNYEAIDFTTLREKWNIPRDVRVILYVGRFEKDKRPLDMISLFNKLDEHNYLLMVGTGALLEQTKQQINLLGLQNRVKIIERIPNKDIWELYCLSDVFVNLNYTEIWGMVLLEAMYYRLGIIAVNAPGPQNIILDNRYGMLAKSDDEILTFLKDGRFTNDIIDAAYQRVTTEFRWSKSGEIMLSMLEGDK